MKGLIILLILNFSLAIKAESFDTVAKLKSQIADFNLILTQTKNLYDIWIVNEQSEYNLKKNFAVIEEDNTKFFEKLNLYVVKKYVVSDDLRTLARAADQMGEAQDEIIDLFQETSVKVSYFLDSVIHIQEGVYANRREMEDLISREDIHPDILDAGKKTIATLKNWEIEIGKIHTHLNDSRAKRAKLAGIVINSIQKEMITRYGQEATSRLRALQSGFNAILKWGDLLPQFHSSTMNYYVGGKELYFDCQYKAGIRKLIEQKMTAQEYRDKANDIEGLHWRARDMVVRPAEFIMSNSDAKLGELKTKPVETMTSCQLTHLRSYQASEEALTGECQAAESSLIAKLMAIETIESYFPLEEEFKSFRSRCWKRR